MRMVGGAITGLVLAWQVVFTTAAAAEGRPNILLLFADDQRADTIATWGNPHIDTPNLDRLVARGHSFRNNYCFGSNSGAVCVPSRAMLLSGRTWFDAPLDLAGVPLLPEVLRAAGYQTFATGKWHNGRESLVHAFPEARSVFLGGMNDHTKTLASDVHSGHLCEERLAARFSSEEFADAAIEFLSGHGGERPFFCYVAFTAPHDPRNPPPEYRQRYYDAPPPPPGNLLPVHPFDNGFAKNIRDENLAPYPRTREVIVQQLCEYYGLITHLDAQVGRILDVLAATDQESNTLVVFAADHGLAMGSHGLLGKQSVYEHSMKCPLVIAGPGFPKGGQTAAFTYLFDLFPTLCATAGAALPAGVAGHDLHDLASGKVAAVRDSVFLPFTDVMRAVRDERHKLIIYPKIAHRQLFDLQADPLEMHNLADDPSHAVVIERLTKTLKDWQAKVGDDLPLVTANPQPKEIRFDDFQRQPDEWQPAWIVQKYFE